MASVGVMAPLVVGGLLHPLEPQVTSVNGKTMARRTRGCRRAMASVDGNLSSSGNEGKSMRKSDSFNQSRINRQMREPSLLETAENAIAEKCTRLEGDEGYRCWEALFEFESIKDEYQQECEIASADEREGACSRLERFQNMIRQSGGASGLIDNVRMVARSAKKRLEQQLEQQQKPTEESAKTADKPVTPKGEDEEGLPLNSLAEELSGMLPESNFTRMLRHSGLSPAWFTRRPDHESD